MHIASSSTTIKFHDFPDNTLVQTFEPTSRVEGPLRSLSWSRDGRLLLLVPYMGRPQIISAKDTYKHASQIDISDATCACFTNSSKRNMAIGCKNGVMGTVMVYDLKQKGVKTRFPRLNSAVRFVGYTAKDGHLYAGCDNGEVMVYSTTVKSLTSVLKIPKSHSVTVVQAHKLKRNYLLGGSNEGVVCVWDLHSNKIPFHADAHSAPVTSAIFSPINASLVVTSGRDRTVNVYDIDNKCRINTITVDNSVTSLEFFENSLFLAMGSQSGRVIIYDTRSFKDPMYSYEAHKASVNHIAVQPQAEHNSSLGLVNEESMVRPTTPPTNRRTSDIFELVTVPATPVELACESSAPKSDDSFLNALGMDHSTNTTGPSHSEQHVITPIVDKDKWRVNALKSTPVSSMSKLSPILAGSMDLGSQVTKDDVKKLIEEFEEREEVKRKDMEQRLAFTVIEQGRAMRSQLLSMHLMSVKDAMAGERRFEELRQEIQFASAGNRERFLMEENEMLRRRIDELQAQIGHL